MKLPLAGIKILDLTTLLPGPLCTQMLGDFGADVIKIEQPKGGDTFRASKPFLNDDTSSLFLLVNRNKKSMTINFKTDEGKQIFYQLVKDADVVVEQFRPGVVKKLGVDYDTLKEINPRLVYCSISGYGQDGPYSQYAGHDINYLGYAGILGTICSKDSAPVLPGIQVADLGAGTYPATIAILLAVMARDKNGTGQYIDIAMLDGAVSWIPYLASPYFATGKAPKPATMMLTGGYAAYKVYKTKDDKYLNIGAVELHLWSNLCNFFGKPEYVAWQRVDSKQDEMIMFFTEQFKSKNRDEWIRLLETVDTCAGPVYNIDEVFQDPQVLHRNMILEVEHPRMGKIKQIASPIKLSETPAQINRLAPDLGEHTEEILLSLGYSKQKIAELKTSGVV